MNCGVNYDALDPGIREVVRLLRDAGFDTTDSGDGVSKPAVGRTLDIPHVHIRVLRADLIDASHAVRDLLKHRGVRFGKVQAPCPHVEATYSPCDGVAVVSVYGVDGAMLVAT